ncbi:galactose-specific lectin nattectin-like [Centropristis striata]|uniref:galactose-specific lectin nattectin-like n=1 Tax=Centropristis striata TaxID=184440 RepID=UPI0027E06AD0|nr:galactose-specific lectin nattectin-like [Centropristis striata]
MASSLYFIVVLCLTSGLWIEGNAQDENSDDAQDDCCKSCPEGWTQFGQKCYMFHFNPKTWGEAERFCTTMGGNLASLHSDEVHDFLMETITRMTGTKTNTWVGAYDATQEGVWLWSDGSKFEYKAWSAVEPNNWAGKEHCMEMNFMGKDYVNDAGCDKKKSFVCARDMW